MITLEVIHSRRFVIASITQLRAFARREAIHLSSVRLKKMDCRAGFAGSQ
jgi:hypothetical protein